MWHKAIWKGHPMRLELTCVGLLVQLANHYTTRGAPVWSAVTAIHSFRNHWAKTNIGRLCSLVQSSVECVWARWQSVEAAWRVCWEAQHSFLPADTGVLNPQGSFPLALTLSGKVRFIVWCLRRPFLKEVDGAQGIFGTTGYVWAKVLRLLLTLKRPCVKLTSTWGTRKIPEEKERPNTIQPKTKRWFNFSELEEQC